MNAYKLADELQSIRKQIWYDINHGIAKNIDEKAKESANMLRQQADRIAELEKELQPTHHEATPCCGYHLADAIKFNPFNKVIQCHNCGQVYTPQAKPLSDEEITEIWLSVFDGTFEDFKKQARAIEAKVRGEK